MALAKTNYGVPAASSTSPSEVRRARSTPNPSRVRLTQKTADGRNRSWNGWSPKCDEAGRVRFEDLLGGEYVVQAQGEKRGRMRIQVPCGTVVFEPDDR